MISRDLLSDALPFGRLWYDGATAVANAIGYAMHSSRSHDAVILVYDVNRASQRLMSVGLILLTGILDLVGKWALIRCTIKVFCSTVVCF